MLEMLFVALAGGAGGGMVANARERRLMGIRVRCQR